MRNALLFIGGLLLLSACRPDRDEGWNLDIVAPIAEVDLSISDITTDSNAFDVNADQSIDVVYEYELYKSGISDILQVPDTTIENTITLKNLTLSDQTITRPISLGEIAQQSGPLGTIIIANNGNTTPIPSFNNTNTNTIPVDATSFFETATLNDGTMEISITNGLPIPITEFVMALKNAGDGVVIASETFTNILPGTNETRSVSLAGKTVDGNLVAEVTKLTSSGSASPVLIDTSDAVEVVLTVKDLDVFSATAIFPAQNLIDDKVDIVYEMGGPELTSMTLKEGELVLTIVSTVQERIFLEYAIPYAVSPDGSPATYNFDVPPAGTVEETIDLSGYTVELMGKDKDTVNVMYNTLIARIDSTGKKTDIALDDSIYVFYGLRAIIPDLAIGYLGNELTTIGPSEESIPLFEKFTDGSLELEDVTMSLDINNGLGATATANIKQLVSRNTRTGVDVPLTSSSLGNDFNINPALKTPFIPARTQLLFTSGNSNIQAFLGNLPDKVLFEAELETNPNGNNNYQDFIYFDSELQASMNISAPLAIKSEGLVLETPMNFNIGELENGSAIKEGTFKLIGYNDFPLSASLQMFVLDASGAIIDSLFNTSGNVIEAGEVNQLTDRVERPRRSVASAYVTEDRMALLRQGKKALIRVTFDTSASGDYAKIYNTYNLNLKLTGDFKYHAKTR